MFFKMDGGAEKPHLEARKVAHIDQAEKSEIAGLSNALRKRHWFSLLGDRAAEFDKEAFEGDRGAMFTVEKGGAMAGFLALTKDREKNSATIKIVRAEMRDPEVIRSLLEQAIQDLRKDGISTVSVKISEDMKSIQHVFEEMRFHTEGEETGRDVLVAHV